MRVLLTALWPVGGVQTFFRYMYGSEPFRDMKFTLVAPDYGISAYLNKHLPQGIITVDACEQSAKSVFLKTRRLLSSQRFDLVHSHGFSAGVVTELARLTKKVPHLLTAHDVFLKDTFSGLGGEIKRIALQEAFRRIDIIHAVTDDGAENLRQYLPRLSAERIRPVLHGIDPEIFASALRRDVCSELRLHNNTLVIGFFGRFMAQKGFRTLVDAVGHIRDHGLVERPLKVLTFGWGGFIREDYAYLQSKGLSDYFIQLPATEDPGGWMKGVDVVAMPSRWEACGLVGMETLCAGAPIVGTHCIGLREVLQGSPAPMVEPQDPIALARALVATADPARRREFQAYQPIAVERFAIDRAAKALRLLYDELAGSRG